MKSSTVVVLLLVGLFTLWVAWGSFLNITTDRPFFVTLADLDEDVQIRRYNTQILAQAQASDMNSGFRSLFDFIVGNNERGEKISMTAPVITQRSDDGMIMSFIMPKGYTMNTLPAPSDPSVRITATPPRIIATISFAGYLNKHSWEYHLPRLMQVLEANGIKTKGAPFALQYNDPWTPPFLRTNEIAFEVDAKDPYQYNAPGTLVI